MTGVRVLIVQRWVAHYRVPLYEALKKQSSTVWLAAGRAEVGQKSGLLTAAGQDIVDIDLSARPISHQFMWQRGVRDAIEHTNPDVVLMEGSTRILSSHYAMLRRGHADRAFVWWYRAWPPHTHATARTAVRLLFDRYLAGFIAYGPSTQAALVSAGIRPNKIVAVQNRSDPFDGLSHQAAVGQANQLRQQLVGNAHPVFVTIGRLEPDKYIDAIIDAFRIVKYILPQSALVIVGSGSSERRLRQQAQGDPDIVFANNISNTASACLIGDVSVFAGLLGLAVIDALKCGVPSVLARAWSPETDPLVHGFNSWFVDNDVQGIASGMWRLGSDKQLRSDLRTGALQSAERLSMERYAEELLDGLSTLAKRWNTRRST